MFEFGYFGDKVSAMRNNRKELMAFRNSFSFISSIRDTVHNSPHIINIYVQDMQLFNFPVWKQIFLLVNREKRLWKSKQFWTELLLNYKIFT